jgi:hypothetical protein
MECEYVRQRDSILGTAFWPSQFKFTQSRAALRKLKRALRFITRILSYKLESKGTGHGLIGYTPFVNIE